MIGTSFCLCQTHKDNDGNIANNIDDDADCDTGNDDDDNGATCDANND